MTDIRAVDLLLEEVGTGAHDVGVDGDDALTLTLEQKVAQDALRLQTVQVLQQCIVVSERSTTTSQLSEKDKRVEITCTLSTGETRERRPSLPMTPKTSELSHLQV